MLVLARMVDESFVLTVDGVAVGRIMVTEINGCRAKIGFDLPANFKLIRSELAGQAHARRRRPGQGLRRGG